MSQGAFELLGWLTRGKPSKTRHFNMCDYIFFRMADWGGSNSGRCLCSFSVSRRKAYDFLANLLGTVDWKMTIYD